MCDRTVILNSTHHPFISHESFVFYRKAFVDTASTLESLVASNVYKQHQPVDRGLVKRIVACMDSSDFTTGDMLKISTQVWKETTW